MRELALNILHLPYISMPYLADCPVVLTVHDLIFERYPAYMPLKHTKLLYHLMMRSAVAKAAHIIVPTQATADDLAVFYKNTRGKTNSVAEGVDAAFQPVHSKAALASVRAKYNLPEQFILTIGTRRPHKNVEQLLAAFAALQHEIQSNLVLAGPVDARFPDNVMELADHWGIRQRVHFPGLIAEADLPALYSAAQVFVFPSRIEGFGLPVLEAMACGTPVIGSSTAAIVEVAGEATAFLVDPDDVAGLTSSLRSVLNLSQEQCRKVCERAITHAENYSWEKTAAATLKIYEEVYARSLN